MMLTRDFTSWPCTGHITQICWEVKQGLVEAPIPPDRSSEGHACSLNQQHWHTPDNSE